MPSSSSSCRAEREEAVDEVGCELHALPLQAELLTDLLHPVEQHGAHLRLELRLLAESGAGRLVALLCLEHVNQQVRLQRLQHGRHGRQQAGRAGQRQRQARPGPACSERGWTRRTGWRQAGDGKGEEEDGVSRAARLLLRRLRPALTRRPPPPPARRPRSRSCSRRRRAQCAAPRRSSSSFSSASSRVHPASSSSRRPLLRRLPLPVQRRLH